MSFGSFSTPPIVSNVNTAPTEGTLPPFPENEAVTDTENRLTPAWRRWFSKQRSWLTDRGSYKPTNITLTGMGGAAAIFGNPVFQWWKQGNIVQVYLDIQFSGVTTGGGNILVKPMPFDPSVKILQNGRSTVPFYVLSCMVYNGAVWNNIPAYVYNGKAATTGTQLVVLNIPTSAAYMHINGTYITDN